MIKRTLLPMSVLVVLAIARTASAAEFDFGDRPDAVVQGPAPGSGSGRRLAVADVNADGIGDLINGAPERAGLGHVYVSFGPLSGTVVAGDDVAITPVDTHEFGVSVAGGDADGDGVDDVLIGATANRGSTAMAHLVLGPLAGDVSTADADLVLHRGSREWFSSQLQIAGDVTGEGRNDLVIAARGTGAPDYRVGAVYVVRGGTTGIYNPENVATYIFRGSEDVGLVGTSATALDDTDGDGIDDVAMSGAEHVFVVPGGIAAGDYDVSTVATATIDVDGEVPDALASVDYDDDGYGDLLFGEPSMEVGGDIGVVRLFAGPLSGAIDGEADALVTWQGDAVGALIAVGDCNGDGDADLLLGGSYTDDHLSLGPVTGVVEVESLPSIPRSGGTALLFAPDWSGDGVDEIVVGKSWVDDGRGAAAVFYSE